MCERNTVLAYNTRSFTTVQLPRFPCGWRKIQGGGGNQRVHRPDEEGPVFTRPCAEPIQEATTIVNSGVVGYDQLYIEFWRQLV